MKTSNTLRKRGVQVATYLAVALGGMALAGSDAFALDWTIGNWTQVGTTATVNGNYGCTAYGWGYEKVVYATLAAGPAGDEGAAQAWPDLQWVYDWGVNDGTSSHSTANAITWVRAACGLSPIE